MTALLELKQKIKNLYGQHEIYILPVLRCILAFLYFTWINVNMGYMSQLNNIFIVLRNNIPSTNRQLRRPQVGFLDARTDFRASLFHVLQDRHAQLQAAQMALCSSSRPHHTIGTHSPRHSKPYVARC